MKTTQYVPFYMAAGSKLLMDEVSPVAVGVTALRASADVIYSDPNDFPVAIEYSERYGLILLISAMGILSAFEIGTATLVVMSKVSTSLIFTSVSEHTEDGLIGVNVQGQVLQIGIDERGIVPYITQKLQNVPLAVRIAGRAKLSGCEDLFIQQFEANFLAQNYGEAAKMAAIAPGGV
ncbi:MAG: putative clathrin heavy chain, partial [Streblomastix strix]